MSAFKIVAIRVVIAVLVISCAMTISTCLYAVVYYYVIPKNVQEKQIFFHPSNLQSDIK